MALALAFQADSRARSSRCRDPLGSVIQIYQNGWPIADACYEPYGGIYAQWNMATGGYRFTWMGGWGYRQTFTEWSSVYVRARHYSRLIGSWLSVDPLWPSEMAYGYVEGRVMTGVDYWGTCAIFYTKAVRTCYCYDNKTRRLLGSKKNSITLRRDGCKGCVDQKLLYECSAKTTVSQSGTSPVTSVFEDLDVKCSGPMAIGLDKLGRGAASIFNELGRFIIGRQLSSNPCSTRGAYVSCSVEAQYVYKVFRCAPGSVCTTVSEGHIDNVAGTVKWENGKPTITPHDKRK